MQSVQLFAINTPFQMSTFPNCNQEVSLIILDCSWEFILRKQTKSRVKSYNARISFVLVTMYHENVLKTIMGKVLT